MKPQRGPRRPPSDRKCTKNRNGISDCCCCCFFPNYRRPANRVDLATFSNILQKAFLTIIRSLVKILAATDLVGFLAVRFLYENDLSPRNFPKSYIITQAKDSSVKNGILTTLCHNLGKNIVIFCGLGSFLCRKQTTKSDQ